MVMKLFFQILEGEKEKLEHTFEKTPINIGRAEECLIRLSNPTVSGKHCIVDQDRQNIVIIDENSSNGVWVNGRRITTHKMLHHGDLIALGDVTLQIGIDRPLERQRQTLTSDEAHKISRQITKVAISLCVLVLLAAAGCGVWFGWKIHNIIKVNPVETLPRANHEFALLSPGNKLSLQLPVFPEQCTTLPSTGNHRPRPWIDTPGLALQSGTAPLFFNGLDLDLPGGGQWFVDDYGYEEKTILIRTGVKKYGTLIITVEGWNGLGPRCPLSDQSLLRITDFPTVYASIRPKMESIQEIAPGKSTASIRQKGDLEIEKSAQYFTPKVKDNFSYSLVEHILMGMISEDTRKTIKLTGRSFLIITPEQRYLVSFVASPDVLGLLKGGVQDLEAVVESSLTIQGAPNAFQSANVAELTSQVNVALDQVQNYLPEPEKISQVDYRHLQEYRALLLKCQNVTVPIPSESRLRMGYFRVAALAQERLMQKTVPLLAAVKRQDKETVASIAKDMRSFFEMTPHSLVTNTKSALYPEWLVFLNAVTQEEQAPAKP
ncbi:TPA: hypothetical protein DDW35_01380 [Candidatus Sumerlaeota bacterium]|nr:hypothetical protein [Candidatus Sumerlaeota bacterium]